MFTIDLYYNKIDDVLKRDFYTLQHVYNGVPQLIGWTIPNASEIPYIYFSIESRLPSLKSRLWNLESSLRNLERSRDRGLSVSATNCSADHLTLSNGRLNQSSPVPSQFDGLELLCSRFNDSNQHISPGEQPDGLRRPLLHQDRSI